MLRSPPSRRRGLKLYILFSPFLFDVASFAEAWIEICVRQVHTANAQRSPPSRRRGLKSDTVYNVCSNRNRRLLRGGVDWNPFLAISKSDGLLSPPSRRRGLKYFLHTWLTEKHCRLLRGGVDWNVKTICCVFVFNVASFAEAWIEMSSVIPSALEMSVASFAEAWIEIGWCFHRTTNGILSPPSRRRGLKSDSWHRQRRG